MELIPYAHTIPCPVKGYSHAKRAPQWGAIFLKRQSPWPN